MRKASSSSPGVRTTRRFRIGTSLDMWWIDTLTARRVVYHLPSSVGFAPTTCARTAIVLSHRLTLGQASPLHVWVMEDHHGWHDPMFPGNFGPFNEVEDLDTVDEPQCWKCSPLDAADDFTLQVENYNINFSRKPIFLAQRGTRVPRYISDPGVDEGRYNRMTDDDARHATSSVTSRRRQQYQFSPPGAAGDHIARKRVAEEVFHAEDSEIRVVSQRPLNRIWKCCCCPFEFRFGEECETIHFCSFDGCQHVMCVEHAHTVGLRYVKNPGLPDLAFPHYFCWHHKHADMYERRVTYFKENNSAQYRRLRRISDRYPPEVNIFQGVEESVLGCVRLVTQTLVISLDGTAIQTAGTWGVR
eukprot:2521386-Amphidinium_carterae.3